MKLTENMKVEIRECIFKSMSECGCCGSYHPTYMDSDNKYTYKRFMGMGCRNDTYRYHPDDMAELLFAAPELLQALSDLHSCHRAFSSNDNWTNCDDVARKHAERLLNELT